MLTQSISPSKKIKILNAKKTSKKTTEMTTNFNRLNLIQEYVDRILDNMSTKDLARIVGEQLEENFLSYSDEELITEVSEYYPELLEEGDN